MKITYKVFIENHDLNQTTVYLAGAMEDVSRDCLNARLSNLCDLFNSSPKGYAFTFSYSITKNTMVSTPYDLVRLYLKDAGYQDDDITAGFEFADKTLIYMHLDRLGQLALSYILYDQAELDGYVEAKNDYQLERSLVGWEPLDWSEVCDDLDVDYTGEDKDDLFDID